MFSASKRKGHILHQALWSPTDKVLADRWRLDYCRKFIASVEEIVVVGGKEITVRAVEFIRTAEDVKGSWHKIGDIIKDPELLASYLLEVEKAQEQAAAKVSRVRMLLQEG